MSISKQGDRYLRSILIHGTRSAVSQAHRKDDRLSRWVTELKQRSHTNVAAVALVNPECVHVRKTRYSNWELAREYP